MTEDRDLEVRITALEDIEAIKKMKAKYWRSVDKSLLDDLAECFTEDAVADFGHHGPFQGKEAIMDFFKQGRDPAHDPVTRTHQGHNPEIELTGDTTAKGVWQLWFYAIDNQSNRGRRSAGYYADEYVKEAGQWKHKDTSISYVFREQFDREKQGLKLV